MREGQVELEPVDVLGVEAAGAAGAAGAATGDAALEVSPLVLVDDEEDDNEDASPFLFDEPEYRSWYQPEPLSRKLPEVMRREAASAPHASQTLMASSVMRCTLSNVWLHAEQRYE